MADEPTNARPGARSRFRFGAWQTLTGRGIAAFAHSGSGRLLGFQSIAAAGVAVVFVLALRLTLFPAVEASLRSLPGNAVVRNGRMQWPGTNAVRLGENAWVDFVVTPGTSDPLGQTADFQFDLRPAFVRVQGALGHVDLPWHRDLQLDLGRIPAAATWGAWRGVGQALLACGVFVWMFVVWWILSAVYAIPGWLLSTVLGRSIPIAGLWRMAGAALVTGAIVASVGFLGYATRRWQLTGLIVIQTVHFVLSPVWLGWGIVSTPRGGTAPEEESEMEAVTAGKGATPRKKRKPKKAKNPFKD